MSNFQCQHSSNIYENDLQNPNIYEKLSEKALSNNLQEVNFDEKDLAEKEKMRLFLKQQIEQQILKEKNELLEKQKIEEQLQQEAQQQDVQQQVMHQQNESNSMKKKFDQISFISLMCVIIFIIIIFTVWRYALVGRALKNKQTLPALALLSPEIGNAIYLSAL